MAQPLAPTADSSSVASQPLMDDADLASLLSRVAAIFGHSVPAYRFGMQAQGASGAVLSQLSRVDRAMELWLGHFPQGSARRVSPAGVSRSDFPMLWLSADQSQVRLLRGAMRSGGFQSEDAGAMARALTDQEVQQGFFISLAVQPVDHDSGHMSPKSAADWFAFALRRHRRIFIEAIFATLVVSLVGLGSALYTMQVYDRVVPNNGFATLWVLTVGVGLAIIFELVMKQVRALMVDRVCKAIDQELSSVFFGKALDIRMDARPSTVGTFASQIRHFESVRNFMTSSTLFILADTPFALLFIGVIALLAGPVALVPLVLVPLAFFIGMAFRKPIEEATERNMAESNYKNGLLIEAIDGIESVKAASGEWKLLERWRSLTARIAESDLALKSMSTLSTNLTQTLQQVTYVGIIAVGAYAIAQGSLTMGGLIACSIISGRALAPLTQIPNLVVQWKHAQIALKALDGIMALPSERDPDTRLVIPERCEGALRLEKLVFSYRKEGVALRIDSLAMSPGERIAVVGPVGSGKSTLIKLLSGLYRPQEGQVFLDGVDMTQLAPEFVREHIGYLPQDVRLFNGTLRDNLTLGLPSPSDSQILRASAMTGLDQVIRQQPRGLELFISEGGKGLSGGQRQLVGLTRLLIAQPRVLLLDEPTASLDGQLEARVMKHLFQEIAPQSLLVVVTHKTAILPHIDRILVVHQGKVQIDGPKDKVLSELRAGNSGGVG
jgi:ATP-binding cassette subfamily C protein LapB